MKTAWRVLTFAWCSMCGAYLSAYALYELLLNRRGNALLDAAFALLSFVLAGVKVRGLVERA